MTEHIRSLCVGRSGISIRLVPLLMLILYKGFFVKKIFYNVRFFEDCIFYSLLFALNCQPNYTLAVSQIDAIYCCGVPSCNDDLG